MPKFLNQKIRLLHIMRYLQDVSDEQHTVMLSDIANELNKYDIICDRKSLYADIEALRRVGMDIVLTKGNRFGYFLANRKFELAELNLLVDAVQSAKFITAKKRTQFKLESLASIHEAKCLRRQVFIDGRIKAKSESIYYAIDRLHEAISKDRQVSFKYFENTLTKTMRYRRNGHVYIVSPYALHWDGNKYFAFYPEHGIAHFRIEHGTDIEILEKPCNYPDENLDLVSYVQQTFSMFGGTAEKVALKFDNDLIGAVIDRFGTDIGIQKIDDQHFSTEVSVNVSPSFLSWNFQFAGKAVITGPEMVVGQMKQMIVDQASLYQH